MALHLDLDKRGTADGRAGEQPRCRSLLGRVGAKVPVSLPDESPAGVLLPSPGPQARRRPGRLDQLGRRLTPQARGGGQLMYSLLAYF